MFYRPHKRVQEDNVLRIDEVTGEVIKPPSMTKQEFAHESDINNIVKHFKPHHMAAMLQANLMSGAYADLPEPTDFQEALGLVAQAEAAFMTVPAKVRDRFGQDPGQFLAFISDPANAEEARELGLVKPLAEPPAPIEVKVVGQEPKVAAPGSVTGGSGGPSGGS